MYLKRDMVGLNNNAIKLTEKQEEMRRIYRKKEARYLPSQFPESQRKLQLFWTPC
jgi:hypothetical protein